MSDLEREMTVDALHRLLEAKSREEAEIAEKCNKIELPWIFGDDQDIIEELDKFLQEHEND